MASELRHQKERPQRGRCHKLTTRRRIISGFDAVVSELRGAAAAFFALPAEEKSRWDVGLGYGFGGFVAQNENAAGLVGSFGRAAPDLVERCAPC